MGGEDGESKALKMKTSGKGAAKAKKASADPSATKIKEPSDSSEMMYQDEVEKVEEGELPPALAKANAAKKDDEDDEQEEVQPNPRTKLGMLKQVQDRLGSMKKTEVEEVLKGMKTKEAEEQAVAEAKKAEEEEPEEEEEIQAKPAATKVEKLKAEDLNLDLSSQTQELFEGQELDEEFKQRASVIFETVVSKAILEQVNQRLETLEEVAAVEIAEGIAEAEVSMAEKIDDYLTYVAEEFCKENELAIERGIRAELAESFITGLKSLFEKHYVDVPEEKVDIVEQLFAKVESLEEKLNVEMQTNIEALKEMKNFKKVEAIAEVCEGLTSVETDKMCELAEAVQYDNHQEFVEKINTLRESYFNTRETSSIEETRQTLTEAVTNTEEEGTEETSDTMQRYTQAIRRVQRIVT
jgi:ribosomal protein S13